MKTLKLSALAAFVLLFVSSCTRDTDSLTSSDSVNSVFGAQAKEVIKEVKANDNKKQELESITLTFSKNPETLGNTVILTGTIVSPIKLEDGFLAFERAVVVDGSTTTYVTAEEGNADEGDWKEYVKIDLTDAVKVTESYDPITENYTYTTTTTFSSSDAGYPTEAGFYGWRLHYVTQGERVFGAKTEGEDLEFKACTTVRGLAFNVIGEPKALENGWYEFTVEYVVNTCNNINNAKLQGGLTAVNSTVTTIPMYTDIKPTKNDNFVITWEGQTVTPGKKYQITFRKLLRGNAPWQITGHWTLKGTDAVTGEVVELTNDENYWK